MGSLASMAVKICACGLRCRCVRDFTSSISLLINKIPRPWSACKLESSVGEGRDLGSNPLPGSRTTIRMPCFRSPVTEHSIFLVGIAFATVQDRIGQGFAQRHLNFKFLAGGVFQFTEKPHHPAHHRRNGGDIGGQCHLEMRRGGCSFPEGPEFRSIAICDFAVRRPHGKLHLKGRNSQFPRNCKTA